MSTRLIKLCLVGLARRVKSQDLDAQKIVAWSNALREVEINPAVILDHGINSPLLAVGIKTVVPDLEPAKLSARDSSQQNSCTDSSNIPLKASDSSRGGIINLGKVRLDRTLVRLGDRVVGVVSKLSTANYMAPISTEPVTSGDVDDGVRLGARLTADNALVIDILDGIVVVRGPDTGQLSLVLSIDGEFLPWALADMCRLQWQGGL